MCLRDEFSKSALFCYAGKEAKVSVLVFRFRCDRGHRLRGAVLDTFVLTSCLFKNYLADIDSYTAPSYIWLPEGRTLVKASEILCSFICFSLVKRGAEFQDRGACQTLRDEIVRQDLRAFRNFLRACSSPSTCVRVAGLGASLMALGQARG